MLDICIGNETNYRNTDAVCNVNLLNVIGRSLSIWAVAAALFLFSTLRLAENNPRLLHIQLLLSNALVDMFILVGEVQLMSLCVESKEAHCPTIPSPNCTQTDAMEVIQLYLIMSNTFWTTCEAVYLVMLIWKVLFNEPKTVLYLSAFGWGAAALLSVIFILINSYAKCVSYFILVEGTIALALLSNIFSLAYIFTFLRNGTQSLRPSSARAFKALLLLVPLFGVHHALVDIDTSSFSDEIEIARMAISALVSSFQGTILACVLCFTNVEVVNALKSGLRRGSTVFRDRISTRETTTATCLNKETSVYYKSLRDEKQVQAV